MQPKTDAQRQTTIKARRFRKDVWPQHMERELQLVRPEHAEFMQEFNKGNESKFKRTMLMYLLRSAAEGVINVDPSTGGFRVLKPEVFKSHVLALFEVDSVNHKTIQHRFRVDVQMEPSSKHKGKWVAAFEGLCEFQPIPPSVQGLN